MGHPVIALSQDQMYEVLKKVSGESARESYSMMKDLLLCAGQLRSEKSSKRRGPTLSSGPRSSPGPKRISSSDNESCGEAGSDTSSVLDSDEARAEGLCMDTVSISSTSQVSSARPVVPKPPTAPTSRTTPSLKKSIQVQTPPGSKRSSNAKGSGKDATPRKRLKTIEN